MPTPRAIVHGRGLGAVQKSSSSKATAIFARGAYWQYVSTEKWRERSWRLFSTDPLGRLAGVAEAIKFEFVGFDGKPVFSGHGFLQIFNLAVVKFHDFPTSRTNQMVVMTFVRHIIELGLSAEMAFLRQSRVAKEFKGAVDRGEADMGVLFGQNMI